MISSMEEERSLQKEITPPSSEDDESNTDSPLGTTFVEWEVDEYPRPERSHKWYILVGGAALLCLIYAVLTANFLFAVIVLM